MRKRISLLGEVSIFKGWRWGRVSGEGGIARRAFQRALKYLFGAVLSCGGGLVGFNERGINWQLKRWARVGDVAES